MKIIESIPSYDNKYILQLYRNDNEIHFERGEIDYFSSRGPGQMAINHTSFYLETRNKHIYFKNFICLYRYGDSGWWDVDSRYFYFASGTKSIFIFDCHENKWAEVLSPIYFLNIKIKNGILEIVGGSEMKIIDTVNVGGNISSTTYQLSDLEWQTEGIEIKDAPKKEPTPTREIIPASYSTNNYPSMEPEKKRRLPVKLRNAIGIIIFIAVAVIGIIVRENHIFSISLVMFLVALIPLLFVSDKGNLDKYDLPKGLYDAWLIVRFVPITSAILLVVNTILIVTIPEYKQFPLSTILYVVAFFFPIIAILSVMGNIIVLRDSPEYRELCKERYRKERKEGKSLLYYFWRAVVRKLLQIVVFFGGLALLIYVVSSLIRRFS
ncbi:MAG: hypothetical protein LBM07_07495 [Culturomica sp.]|jgi:hypothetical protein|nr:hypothetical protein [Culturomica sp.]